MKNSIKTSVIVAIGALVVIAGWLLWQYLQAPALPSDIASGNGRIEAVQIDISTKIPGRVESITAQEGDLITAGQVVAKIETNQLRAQLLNAEADVASAQSLVASAQASIAQTQAQQILAQQEMTRSQELVKKHLSSKEDFDTKVSQLAVAKANVEAAQATLVSKQRNVDAAQANVTEIQTQIDDATLVSPSIGRVLYRLVEPGEVLGSGGKVLTLLNLNDIYMELFLPATQVQRVSIGAEARIKLDVLDVAIPAYVTFVSPESQFTPKSVETASEREKLMFRVKVRIPQTLVSEHIELVKTRVRGVAYILLTPLPGEVKTPWPVLLQKLPKGYVPNADNSQ